MWTPVHAKAAAAHLREDLLSLTATAGNLHKVRALFRAEDFDDQGLAEAYGDLTEAEMAPTTGSRRAPKREATPRESMQALGEGTAPSLSSSDEPIEAPVKPRSSGRRAAKKKASDEATQSPGKRRKTRTAASASKRKRE